MEGSKNHWVRILAGVLEFSNDAAAKKIGLGRCRMTRWRKSAKKGSIYRVK